VGGSEKMARCGGGQPTPLSFGAARVDGPYHAYSVRNGGTRPGICHRDDGRLYYSWSQGLGNTKGGVRAYLLANI
jgi:hypothetical protein